MPNVRIKFLEQVWLWPPNSEFESAFGLIFGRNIVWYKSDFEIPWSDFLLGSTAIIGTNLFLFVKNSNGLDPPATVFLESFKELFKKTYFRRTKVPQNVWNLVILSQFYWKNFKPKANKVPQNCLEFGHPPPLPL